MSMIFAAATATATAAPEPFTYRNLDCTSWWLTLGALLFYIAFCGYGIWKCWHESDGWQGTLTEKNAVPQGGQAPTSFSRVAAAIGAYFLTAFFILLGGFVISRLWFPSGQNGLKDTLGNLSNFILAGAALFAPYAFNQLSQVFGKGNPSGPGGQQVADGKGGDGQPRFNPNMAGSA